MARLLGPGALLLPALLSLAACIEPVTVQVEPPQSDAGVGETRYIELRFVRLDVEGFGKTVTIDALRALPPSVLEEVWLLDMELTGLVTNALEQLRDLDTASAAELPVAAQNMRRLLRTTPDNVVLDGTSLEELISLSAAIGIPAASALADILQVGITEEVIPIEAAARATVVGLIASHPSAQFRMGVVDDEHPDGVWPVAENSIPVTLGDVVNNFENLPARFGPADTEFGMHPGFIEHATGFTVIEEDFAMTMRISANALPYKGVDATTVTEATVNSLGGQIEGLFDTDDPDWLTVEGLVPDPSISSMTVTIVENDAFVPGGTAQEPTPLGNSEVWDLPPWEFERLVAEMVVDSSSSLNAGCVTFELGTGVDAFESCVDENAWVTFETFADVGSPPAPSYMWDIQSELAQVRLHDGGLGEGDADVQFTLSDVPLGVSSEEITEEIAENIAANPSALKSLANELSDATDGAADFFYFRPAPGGPAELDGDWLFFVAQEDIGTDEEGNPLRPYGYDKVGFFSDEGCTAAVSEAIEIEGDDSHQKIKISSGDRLFFQDDAGHVFRIDVSEKPSAFKVGLEITRVS
jgi:hypothetical protein